MTLLYTLYIYILYPFLSFMQNVANGNSAHSFWFTITAHHRTHHSSVPHTLFHHKHAVLLSVLLQCATACLQWGLQRLPNKKDQRILFSKPSPAPFFLFSNLHRPLSLQILEMAKFLQSLIHTHTHTPRYGRKVLLAKVELAWTKVSNGN